MQRTILAPAKINLILDVLGRRTNGYHDVAMLMVRLSLHDKVTVSLLPTNTITIDCPGLNLAVGEENIAVRAARLFLTHTGINAGVGIRIDKQIPAAAGLGGGSSDAAAVLLALNDMLGTGMSRAELQDLGVRLGADVPFFLFGQMSAWATGIGEVLEAWPGLPKCTLVLANPGVAVSTAWVYENLQLTQTCRMSKIPRFPERAEELGTMLRNDLERVTVSRHPEIAVIKDRLLQAGALGALMSGSGPTVFGVFGVETKAAMVAEDLSRGTGWWTAAVSPF